jgi:hypothetical protein
MKTYKLSYIRYNNEDFSGMLFFDTMEELNETKKELEKLNHLSQFEITEMDSENEN